MAKLKVEFCDGCNSKEERGSNEFICMASSIPNKGRKRCPCSKCLIKSTCNESCESFVKYVNNKNRFIEYDVGSVKHRYISTVIPIN